MLILSEGARDVAIEQSKNLGNVIGRIFSHIDALVQPETVLGALEDLWYVWAIVFLVCGILTMINGYRMYPVVTTALAAMIGIFVGYRVGQHMGSPEVVAGCLGLLFGVLCVPFMKYAVAVIGGLVGAFWGANLWASAISFIGKDGPPETTIWIGALMGLVICGMLSFIVFKLTVVFFTSVSGSTMAVLGAVALLLQIESFRGSVTDAINNEKGKASILLLLVLVPAIIGMIMQDTTDAEVKKS